MLNHIKQFFATRKPVASSPVAIAHGTVQDDSLIVEMPTRFVSDVRNMSAEELAHLYTTGKCYQLALAMHCSNPERFTMWEITSRIGVTGEIVDEYSAHWVVRDNVTRKFVDANGSHKKIENVLDGWDDFEGDTTVRYYERKDRTEAIRIMNRSFGSADTEPTFPINWQTDALYTVAALKLF